MPTCYRHPGRESYIRCQRCNRTICPDCMREAAVGYQCPSCVAEGARETRQARTAYGGQRSGNPALTSMVLIGMNAAVWLAIILTGGASSRLVSLLALRPKGLCDVGRGGLPVNESVCLTHGGTWLPGVDDGAWWQLVTNTFTHVEIWHIGFNMLALWFLGPQLELALGRARFLAVYLLSGLTASMLVYWASPEYQATLGASGAIFGLLGALLVLVIKVGGNVSTLVTWLVLNAVITFTVPHISWQGHVGGFLAGVLLTAILVYAPRQRRQTWQWVGLAGYTVLVLVAIAARFVHG